LRQQYSFAAVISIIRCSFIIIGTAVYFPLKFILVGGPLVEKRSIFLAKQRRLLHQVVFVLLEEGRVQCLLLEHSCRKFKANRSDRAVISKVAAII